MNARYEGVARTIDAALHKAQQQVPRRDGRDFTVSKVVEWGGQRGGFIDETLYYVVVEEDPDAPFRTIT